MAHILVAEDERNVALPLKNALLQGGHTVEIARDGERALERAKQGGIDLILLDLGLPKKDGNTVCLELRAAGNRVPIIMLTAREKEIEKAMGLDIGADDYIVKPWQTLELLARIRAVLRRTLAPVVERYCFDNIEINVTRREVLVDGTPRQLTPAEFRLLHAFVLKPGAVQSREHLCAVIQVNSPEALKNHVMNLRLKLEPKPSDPIYFVATPTFGYRFDGLLKTHIRE